MKAPPGTPYAWRGTLDDGTVVERGSFVVDEVPVLSPMKLPAGRLRRLELVAVEPGWPPRAEAVAGDGEEIRFFMTREGSVGEHPRPVRTIAVALGVRGRDGQERLTWLLPDGTKVEGPRSYEELEASAARGSP